MIRKSGIKRRGAYDWGKEKRNPLIYRPESPEFSGVNMPPQNRLKPFIYAGFSLFISLPGLYKGVSKNAACRGIWGKNGEKLLFGALLLFAVFGAPQDHQVVAPAYAEFDCIHRMYTGHRFRYWDDPQPEVPGTWLYAGRYVVTASTAKALKRSCLVA